MKKVLALILALMMIFSVAAFSGCSNGEDDTPDTSTTPDDNTPEDNTPEEDTTPQTSGNDIQAMLDAGEEVLAAFVNDQFSDSMMLGIAESLKSHFTDMGVTFEYASFESDYTQAITLIENYETMGVKLIIIGGKPDNFADISQRLLDEDIIVVIFGQNKVNFPVSATANSNAFDVAYNMALMAQHWLDETYPDAAEGSIHAAQSLNSPNDGDADRTTVFEMTIYSDPRVERVYTQDLIYDVNAGYTFAEEAMIYDPDIRLFLCFTESVAMGVSNYICSKDEYDPSQFAAFGGGVTDAAVELVNQSDTNTSCLRGVVAIGSTTDAGASLFETCRKLLLGEITKDQYPYFGEEPLENINLYGIEYERNPYQGE